MLVDVGEVHTKPKAFDVGELQVAVGDVAPVAIPGREHVGAVRVIVRGGHWDTGHAGDRIEEEMYRSSVVGCLELGEIFFELRHGAATIGTTNAHRARVVERRYADALA